MNENDNSLENTLAQLALSVAVANAMEKSIEFANTDMRNSVERIADCFMQISQKSNDGDNQAVTVLVQEAIGLLQFQDRNSQVLEHIEELLEGFSEQSKQAYQNYRGSKDTDALSQIVSERASEMLHETRNDILSETVFSSLKALSINVKVTNISSNMKTTEEDSTVELF